MFLPPIQAGLQPARPSSLRQAAQTRLPEQYVPTVRELKRRYQPAHLLGKALRSDVKPTPDHLFTEDEISPALRRLFAIAEAHADLLDNLTTETSALNGALNSVAEDSLHNARLLTAQVRDEARQTAQHVAGRW